MSKLRALAVLVITGGLALTPITAEAKGHNRPVTSAVPFDLNARVLDSGEQVTSVTLDTSRLRGIDPSSLTTSTFTVHAKSTSPVPITGTEAIYSLYDEDRVVTGVSLQRGRIVIDLKHGYGVTGASTLGYLAVAGRNVLLDLTYTITQNSPIKVRGADVTLTAFTQGRLVSPEVDAFAYGVSKAGLNYRLFKPNGHRANRPLVIWLHGNGEGGVSAAEYNNESPLRANRGALGPATAQAQRILGGAYVLAPQVPDTWYNVDTAGYDVKLKALIDQIVRKHRINPKRVYLMGASAGGFMAMQQAGRNPKSFAAVVPTAPALYLNRTGAYTTTAEQVLLLKGTPTWLVQSKDDPTVPFDKASQWAYDLLKPYGKVLLSAYDNVTWDGVTYSGHWSWIYTARNDPQTATGQHLWQWMAKQQLHRHWRR